MPVTTASHWPHQARALAESGANAKSGIKNQCIVGPCGSGKTLEMMHIACKSAHAGRVVYIYTHRILLTSQIIADFQRAGEHFGVVGSQFKSLYDPTAKIQICSLPTVHRRIGGWRWELPYPNVVIVDEAHQQTGAMAQEVFDKHSNAKRIGFTATPVNLGSLYDCLVDGGQYSEMLDCNAHLPIDCYGPDQPDLSQLKPMASGDFSQEDDRRINRVPTIFGSVYKNWLAVNPFQLPAVGFAPGCQESEWFVDEFRRKGVPCAHIDAERVVLVERGHNGVLQTHEFPSTNESRQAVIDGSKNGTFKIVWNRFVMREAINVPEWYHAIAATSMGSVSTYLQSIGRVLRYHPTLQNVCFTDHGGNLVRHGFPNEDREWVLGDTNRSVQARRKKKIEQTKGDEAEPICCPRCAAFRSSGEQCHNCGYIHKRSVRMVRQLDGTLVRKVGRDTKYKKPKDFNDILSAQLFRGAQVGMKLSSAMFLAKKEAEKKGIPVEKIKFNLPPPGSDKWKMEVGDYYPKMKRK